MDIFSAGCVIAEIFLENSDGKGLFDLPHLKQLSKQLWNHGGAQSLPVDAEIESRL